MKLNQKYFSSEKGFTLIELLIAVVLIVFGLLSYGVFVGNTVVQNTKMARTTQAITYAQEKLEELRSDAIPNFLVTGTTTDALDGIYTRTATITNGGAGNFTGILVTVSWANSTGPGDSTISLRTSLSQN